MCGGCSCRAVVSSALCQEGAKAHVQPGFHTKSERVCTSSNGFKTGNQQPSI